MKVDEKGGVLSLTRRAGESVEVFDLPQMGSKAHQGRLLLRVRVVRVGGDKVVLRFEEAESLKILRSELSIVE